MADKRYTMQEVRDYRGVQLPDLIQDLGEHRDFVRETLKELCSLRAAVEKNSGRLDEPGELIEVMDDWISKLEGIWNDLCRLSEELPYGVEDIHFEIIRQIHECCVIEKRGSCRAFKEAFICRDLKDASFRGLLDEIHSIYCSRIFSLLVLSDINTRLKTFLGESLYNREPVEKGLRKPSISVVELPPETRWEDLTLVFIGPEDIQILVKGKHHAAKSYKELAFLDRRTNKKTDIAGKPSRLWKLLAIFAKCEGEISWENADLSAKDKDQLVKAISDLRGHLQAIFQIKTSPIDAYKKAKKPIYKTKFQVALRDSDTLDRIIDWTSGGGILQQLGYSEPDENS
jgi:hypothetical protein